MAKLSPSKAEIECLIDLSPAVHYIAKSTGDFGAVFISEGIRDQLGYEPSQFTEDSEFWANCIHADDRPRVLADMDELLTKGHDVLEYRFRHADGSWRWMHDELRVVRDEEDNPLQIVGSWLDITTRKSTEGALRQSESRLNEAQRMAKIGSYEWNIVTGVHWWSEERYRMAGRSPETFKPTRESILETVHPEDRQHVAQVVDSALTAGGAYSMEFRTPLSDGSVRIIHSQGEVSFDQDGRPVRMVGTAQDITELKEALGAIARRESALREAARLKDQLEAEKQYLREEIKHDHNFDDIVGSSDALQAVFQAMGHVSGTNATVLLLGETGTGKELFARAIHANSERHGRALIKVDCATLPDGLVESELFGHVKGAFTGAHASRAGRFELADGGTIFLDEIGELSAEVQAKLLRVLQEGEIQRLGAQKVQKVDVRVIAATNRNIKIEVEEGRFRADLFYRLNVFPIEIPPLRHRREDIPLLTAFFISKCTARFGRHIERVPLYAQEALAAYDWPGNVRELQNVIERSVILSRDGAFELGEGLGQSSVSSHAERASLKQDLEDIERRNILRTLEDCNWKIKGEANAANQLGLKPSTLRSRMQRLGISRPSSGIQ